MNERERLAEAMIELVLERGYEAATPTAVAERAGLEPAAFERHYASVEECGLRLFERFQADFDERVFGGFEAGESEWRDRLRAAAYSAARYIRDNPREADFSRILLFTGGDAFRVHREWHMRRLVELIDAGRQELDDPGSISPATAEAVVGSIQRVAIRAIAEGGGTTAIEERVQELMYLAVRPYLGLATAQEELRIPPPPELDGDAG